MCIGQDIKSAGIPFPDSIKIDSGTSFSSPLVAGTMALIIGKSHLTPAEATAQLIKLSTKNVVEGLNRKTPNRFLRVPYKRNKRNKKVKSYT